MDYTAEFLDAERMRISCGSLIINVASINEKFEMLKDFMAEFHMGGYTNGKLLVISQMASPPFALIEFVEEKLEPIGFLKKEDFVFAEEELVHGANYTYTPHLNKSHPDCEGVFWLGSIISTRGNLVWHLDEIENPNDSFEIIPI